MPVKLRTASKAAPKPATASVHPRYSVHPSVLMLQEWIAALPQKTGRSLEQWLRLIKKEAPAGEAQRRDWLKAEHKMGSNTAWWLAERSVGKGGEEDTPEGYLAQAVRYVDAMYEGKKAGLRPLHDAVIDLARSIAKDVKICPCKTIVPLYREHVFAQIKPATNSRIDLGLCLIPLMKKGGKVPALLIDTGGFAKKDRITHRIPLASTEDLTADVKKWLAKAYELDA